MRFLVDRCAGHRLADWLRQEQHDVVEARERGPDPGDRVLLSWAAAEQRVLVTIDTDFGAILFVERALHSGMVRLPDVPAAERIYLMRQVIASYTLELETGAIVTVRGGRIRISWTPSVITKAEGN